MRMDIRPEAEYLRIEGTAVDVTAFREDDVAQLGVADTRARQKSRMRVHRPPRIVEGEGRAGERQLNVRVVERVDRPDVGPVSAEHVRVDVVRAERGGNHLAAEI